MSKVDELKAEIERLPGEEFAELFRWLSEKDWERWDKEIEAIPLSGRSIRRSGFSQGRPGAVAEMAAK